MIVGNDEAGTDGPDRFELVEQPESGRFDFFLEGELVGFANYSARGHDVVVPHVETLLAFRGRGIGEQLVAHLLDRLRTSGRTITPLCSFAAAYIHHHPDQHDLLSD